MDAQMHHLRGWKGCVSPPTHRFEEATYRPSPSAAEAPREYGAVQVAHNVQPRRPYLAKNFAASSATVSERNTQMSPLEVRTKRPQPLVSISLSFPDTLILIRYMAVLSFHEVWRKTSRYPIMEAPGFSTG
jgi:hypothetical protein